MLFESNIKDLLSLLPQRRLHRAKQRMRELLIQKRRMLSAEERTAQSELILSQLEKMTVFREAKTVLLYYPKNNEVDVLPLFKRYKRDKVLLLPVTHRNGMTANPYEGNDKMHRGKVGIPEPTTPPFEGNIDIIIVPAVAFDKQGNRLGRGKGYYDKLLPLLSSSYNIGICYQFQALESIPTEEFDRPMDEVWTEEGRWA